MHRLSGEGSYSMAAARPAPGVSRARGVSAGQRLCPGELPRHTEDETGGALCAEGPTGELGL